MAIIGTYDAAKVNVQINAIALTDFNGDIDVAPAREKWETSSGVNGAVQRSRTHNKLYQVTLPMMQMSDQLNALAALSTADEATGAGPYVFSIVDLNGTQVFMGSAWIRSMGNITKGQVAGTRTVILDAVEEIKFEGV